MGSLSENQELLAAAQAGNRLALEKLLEKHRNGVYRYGLTVCRTSEDAEDAVQETLWAAARAIRFFRGTASGVAAWMFTIVRHQCYRSLARWHRAETATLPPVFQAPLEDVCAGMEQRRLLVRALMSLDPLDRQVLILRDIEERTAPEAAQLMGVSVAALKSRLHRARAALRARLEATMSGNHKPGEGDGPQGALEHRLQQQAGT